MKQTVKIFTEDCVLAENELYFCSRDWNGLYRVDLKSNRLMFISRIPQEEVLTRRLCAGIVLYKGKLFFSPMMARKIWIYDLKNNQWTGIERKCMADGEPHQEIFKAIKYKNYLFFIGSNYPAIIRMDLDTYELDYLTEPYTALEPLKNNIEPYFRCDFSLRDNRLLLASCLGNLVLCVNLDTLEFTWHEVGEKRFCYSGIVWDGKNYWLSPRKGTPIVKWNGKDVAEYFPLPEVFGDDKYNFLGIQYCNGKVILPGMLQDKTIILESNTQNKNLKIYKGQYTFYKCLEENHILSQNRDALLQWKNPDKGEEFSVYCELPTKELMDYFVQEGGGISDQEIWIETSFPVMPLCVETLKKEAASVKGQTEYGVNIWKHIRN